MDLFSNLEEPTLPFIIPDNIESSHQWDDHLKIFRIRLPHGELLYSRRFFSSEVSDRALAYLQENDTHDSKFNNWRELAKDENTKIRFSNINWNQDTINLYGKTSPLPRLTAWYGDSESSYSYSGIKSKPNPWNKGLLYMKSEIERVTCTSFNSVLLNWYRDGDDHLGWHADNERELGTNPTIASLSLGETRDFVLRLNNAPSEKFTIPLEHGSLLVMYGDIQKFWQHSLPKRKKIRKSRINLTFRQIKTGDNNGC